MVNKDTNEGVEPRSKSKTAAKKITEGTIIFMKC